MGEHTPEIISDMIRTAEADGEKFVSERTVVSPDAIDKLRRKFPGIPEDYLAYLGVIGPGSILSCSYAIYDGPIEPDEIFGFHDDSWPKDLIAFGDNFSGDLGIFLPSSNWAVAELWHDDLAIVKTEVSFLGFVGDLIENLTAEA